MRRSHGSEICSAVLVSLAVALGNPPAAAAEQLALDWAAPPECPGPEAVRTRVGELLGPPREEQPRPELSVTGRVTHDDRGYHLEIESVAGGTRGRRRLSAESCDELTAAGAVVIALAIDPGAVGRADAESVAAFEEPLPSDSQPVPTSPAGAEPLPPQQPVETPAPAPPNVPSQAPEEPAEEPADPGSPYVGLAALVEAGVLPSVGAGLALLAGWEFSQWRAEFNASYFPQRFAESDDDPEQGADIQLAAGSAGWWWTLVPGTTAFAAGMAVEGGYFYAKGRSLNANESTWIPWLALRSGVELSFAGGGPVSLLIRAEAAIPLGRSEFGFRRNGEWQPVHRPWPVAPRGALGLRVAF